MNVPDSIEDLVLLVGVSLTTNCFLLDCNFRSEKHRKTVTDECTAAGCYLHDWNMASDSKPLPVVPGVYKLRAEIRFEPEWGEGPFSAIIGWGTSYSVKEIERVKI